jgi:hypothetical protein
MTARDLGIEQHARSQLFDQYDIHTTALEFCSFLQYFSQLPSWQMGELAYASCGNSLVVQSIVLIELESLVELNI